MRIVGQQSEIWKQCGVAATDVAALVGCAAEERSHVYSLLAHKIWLRERSVRKVLLEQSSPEWLEWRKKGVGASEVAPIVGGGYGGKKTATDIWKEKTGQGQAEAVNANIQRGHKLEPIARKRYEELYGWSVEPLCVLHDEHDFVRCSLDGLRSDDKLVVEIKAPGQVNHRKFLEIQQQRDPLARQTLFARYMNYYRLQAIYQLLITDAEVLHFVSYSEDKVFPPEMQMVVFEVYPEPEEQQRLLERVVEFWKFVQDRVLPPSTWALPAWEWPSSLKIPDYTLSV